MTNHDEEEYFSINISTKKTFFLSITTTIIEFFEMMLSITNYATFVEFLDERIFFHPFEQ